jgi:hypothetical protein
MFTGLSYIIGGLDFATVSDTRKGLFAACSQNESARRQAHFEQRKDAMTLTALDLLENPLSLFGVQIELPYFNAGADEVPLIFYIVRCKRYA